MTFRPPIVPKEYDPRFMRELLRRLEESLSLNSNAEAITDGYVLTAQGDGSSDWEVNNGAAGGTEGTSILSTGEVGGSKFLREDGDNTSSWQGVEGTVVLSTGEVGGSKFLREDGDNSSSWQTLPAGGSDLEVEDEGTSLTTAATKFNFVGDGVIVTEPVTDELLITVGNAVGTTSEYCPGYTFGYVDADTFTVDGFDVINLFNVGRRIKFSTGGVDIYGTVNALPTFSTDTTIEVTMEGGASLANVAYTMCFTAGIAAWSPIATDPFGGTAINAIVSGLIGATIYWIAVGTGGKIYGSTDKGITWTAGTGHSTVVTLNAVAYDITNEEFMVVGNDGVFARSTNGTSWTEDTTSIPALTTTGTGHIVAVAYDISDDAWLINFVRLSTSNATANSTDAGANWTTRDVAAEGHILEYLDWYTYGRTFCDENVTQLYYYNDSAASNASLWTTQPGLALKCWAGYDNGGIGSGGVTFAMGAAAGRLTIGVGTATYGDTVNFSNTVNGVAYSSIDGRFVAVLDLGEIAYIDSGDFTTTNSWAAVSNGFTTTANILDIEYNATGAMFVAVADNGEICRSTNGIS